MSEYARVDFRPRYDLSPDEIKAQEDRLLALSIEQYGVEGLFGVWSEYDSPLADVSRSYEKKEFPLADQTPMGVEMNSLFYLVFDTREGANRSVHSITATRFNETDIAYDLPTNTVTIDDLVKMGNFTHREFYQHYIGLGVDLTGCFSVETFLRIDTDRRVPRHMGQRIADIALLQICEKGIRNKPEIGTVGVFASINDKSAQLFKGIGLEYSLLMDRDDFVTAEAELGELYTPVFIPFSENNALLCREFEPFMLPEIST